MSKADKKSDKKEGDHEVGTKRLPKLFSTPPDMLLNSRPQRSQANKKSYVPNLKVTRHKNAEDKTSEADAQKDFNNRAGKGQRNKANNSNNTGKGNKRNGQTLIQTHGFLSEGIAGAPVQKRFNADGGGSSRDVGVEAMVKPKLVKKDPRQNKEDLESEQKVLLDFLADEDSDMDADSKTSSEDLVPIKIKSALKSCNRNGVVRLSTNSEVKVKIEASDEDFAFKEEPVETLNGIQIKLEPGLETTASTEPHYLDGLFKADSQQILLFQLPDSMPGRMPEEDEKPPVATTSTGAEAPVAPRKPKLCTLDHLEEGLIGKLIKHRSGKTKLLIGDSVFDIDSGLGCDFIQSVVTVEANSQQRSANMYSLGHIQGKFNVTPDWNWLFDKMTKP